MEPALTLSRTFDAPRSLVWETWTSPEHAKEWFGPHGFTCPVYESDLRAGGKTHYEMQAPDGRRYPNTGVYEDVRRPERIVLRDSVEITPGKPAFEARTTLRFSERDGKTTLDVEQSYSKVAPGAEAAIEGAPEGWNQMLDKFGDYLARLKASR